MSEPRQLSTKQSALANYLSPALLGTVSLAVVPLLGIFIQGSFDGWTSSPTTTRLGIPESVHYLWGQWRHLIILGTVLSAIVGPTYLPVWRRGRTRSEKGTA